MKKRQIANLVMAALIVLLVTAGILTTGHILGWFDKPDENTALLTEFRGIITLEREGVAYRVSEDTVLRSGDQITCDPGATVMIRLGDDYITLGQGAAAEITVPAADGFAMGLTGGEAFINAASPVTVSFDGKQAEFADAVALLSVRSGAQSISVYAGVVEDVPSGQTLEWVGEERTVRASSVNSLNDFNIGQIRKANESKTLCFSNEDLDDLEADRLAQLQAQLTAPAEPENTEVPVTAEPSVPAQTQPPTAPGGSGGQKQEQTPQATDAPATEPPATVPPAKEPVQTQPPAATVPPETESPTEPTAPAETEPKPSCTISIRCDTILNNMDSLDPAKAGYVPSSGCILSSVRVEFTAGETVFDILKRVCSIYGIQLEYSWTPMYNSYYVEGINNLYEFDCGSQSGWMYQVNGWFPNYGCSAYTVSDGDSIVWRYTCNGLGADVGG